jgi:hypothetical protein
MIIEVTYLISKKKGYKTFTHQVNEVQLKNWFKNNLSEYVKDITFEKANNNVPYKWKILT